MNECIDLEDTKTKWFDSLIEVIERSGSTPTLGYAITIEQFNIIAEVSAKHIYHNGFDWYLDEMRKWKLKILPYHKFRFHTIYAKLTETNKATVK